MVMIEKPLRTVTLTDGTIVSMMDLKEGQTFNLQEPTGEDLGWWISTSTPRVDKDGIVGIMAEKVK